MHQALPGRVKRKLSQPPWRHGRGSSRLRHGACCLVVQLGNTMPGLLGPASFGWQHLCPAGGAASSRGAPWSTWLSPEHRAPCPKLHLPVASLTTQLQALSGDEYLLVPERFHAAATWNSVQSSPSWCPASLLPSFSRHCPLPGARLLAAVLWAWGACWPGALCSPTPWLGCCAPAFLQVVLWLLWHVSSPCPWSC